MTSVTENSTIIDIEDPNLLEDVEIESSILKSASHNHITSVTSTTNSKFNGMKKPSSVLEDVEIEPDVSSASFMVATARYAFNNRKTKSIKFRKEQLKKLLLLFEENSDMIEKALHQDLNRHPTESMMFETHHVKTVIIKALQCLDDWIKPEKPNKIVLNFLDKISICNDSLGVVLIISSWNFPIQVLFSPMVGAIAAGNCVILKPSELAKECESVIAKLVPKYLDKECYQVYLGGVEKMSELLAERFDHIFFTGSTFVGRIIHKAANKYLTPTTLELGGKSPCYIDESVNLHMALRRIIWAKCANAGQVCIAPDYLLCTPELQLKIIPLAKEIVKEYFGDDIKSSPDYCRIINNNHFKRLVKFLNVKEDIVMGGNFDESQRFIEPTILVNVRYDDPIMQEEIFGPILPIIPVKRPYEAIHFINEGEKPLIIHLFTLDKEVKDLFINNTSSGTIAVNDTFGFFVVDTLPFGGVGYSGMGSYHGKFTYDTFVHKKGVFETNFMPSVDKILSNRNPPYSDKKAKMMKKLLKPRKEISLRWFNNLLIFLSGAVIVVIIKLIIDEK